MIEEAARSEQKREPRRGTNTQIRMLSVEKEKPKWRWNQTKEMKKPKRTKIWGFNERGKLF